MVAAQQVVETPVILSNTEFCFRLWGDGGGCLTCFSRRSLARQILWHRAVDISRCLSFFKRACPSSAFYSLLCCEILFGFCNSTKCPMDEQYKWPMPWDLNCDPVDPHRSPPTRTGDKGSFFDSLGFESRTRVFKEAREAQSAWQPHHKMHWELEGGHGWRPCIDVDLGLRRDSELISYRLVPEPTLVLRMTFKTL